MFTKIVDYLLGRLNEFSTYVAIALLVLAVLFLPQGLTAFIIVGLAIVLLVAPDTKFSEFVKKYFL